LLNHLLRAILPQIYPLICSLLAAAAELVPYVAAVAAVADTSVSLLIMSLQVHQFQ
jgi:hypothetical protein